MQTQPDYLLQIAILAASYRDTSMGNYVFCILLIWVVCKTYIGHVSNKRNADFIILIVCICSESRLKQPDILFGRTGQELPCLRICPLQADVIATHTGPDGGLTTVNRGVRGHVTSQDPDVIFIDSEDEQASSLRSRGDPPAIPVNRK